MRGRGNGRYEQDLPSEFTTDGHQKVGSGEDSSGGLTEFNQLKEDYHRRREEMRTLASEFEMGGATIDREMRLVPVPRGNRERERGIFDFDDDDQDLHRGGIMEGRGGGLDEEGFRMDGDDPLNDDLIPDVPDMLPAIFGLPMHGEMDEEEMMQRNIERKESEAAEIIKLAVERYRREGVAEEEFEVILVPPHYDDYISLTLRRICFAVFFVIGAFTCLMLQTIPLMDTEKAPDLLFDKLLYELLDVRSFESHLKDCGGLTREEEANGEIDCASGVLHIPPTNILNTLNKTKDLTITQQEAYMAYRNGVNISWTHPCVLKDLAPSSCVWKQECKEEPDDEKTCEAHSPLSCFRGVHDGIISDEEVDGVLRLSALLVKHGGDHMEIHNDVKPLIGSVPSVTEKLHSILRSDYALPPIHPVAFRISVSLPSDSNAMYQHAKQATLLKRAVNTTAYMKWEKHFQERYEWSGISLPPLIRNPPFRDPCILMADLEANSTFAFHTSIFLSDGAGENFSGGVSLYADDHISNSNPRNKIQRGVSIDGSRGRVVVSSGGHDNLRCKFPTRTGIRAVLQVWWDCDV